VEGGPLSGGEKAPPKPAVKRGAWGHTREKKRRNTTRRGKGGGDSTQLVEGADNQNGVTAKISRVSSGGDHLLLRPVRRGGEVRMGEGGRPPKGKMDRRKGTAEFARGGYILAPRGGKGLGERSMKLGQRTLRTSVLREACAARWRGKKKGAHEGDSGNNGERKGGPTSGEKSYFLGKRGLFD